tara:strand:+ start:1282 stop:2466 length:1185 start_codon:yes stop_codon:yes gene_type:complete
MNFLSLNIPEIKNWIKKNFFSSKLNSILTIFSTLLVFYIINSLINFLSGAEWELIKVNRRLLLLGRLPLEETWRAWPILWYFIVTLFLTIGAWGSIKKKELILITLAFALPTLIFFTSTNLLPIVFTFFLGGLSFFISKHFLRDSLYIYKLRRILIFLWLIMLPVVFLILLISGGPKPTLWGGFLLNILLASVAIVAGFPLGTLLAVGRATKLPVIRTICTLYIEIIRGAPLVGWLLLAWFVLPKFLPKIFGLNETSVVIRAMIVLSFFASAYIAEVIRGGLQSIPKGQIDAADALNLGYIRKMGIIVLPQAIRVVIPAIVSTFIAMFKDTSLVFILALTDLLQVGRLIPEQNPEFFGRQIEALLVVAFLFWIVSVSLSNLSSKIEKNLGIGTR